MIITSGDFTSMSKGLLQELTETVLGIVLKNVLQSGLRLSSSLRWWNDWLPTTKNVMDCTDLFLIKLVCGVFD